MTDDPPERLMANPAPGGEEHFVSRAGLKLAAALRSFQLPVTDAVAADLGSNVGGFVDCLIQHGAGKVYAIDTGYGVLAWKLRKDPRVVVMECRNALHTPLPELVDLITIDVGWTRQAKILPAARKLLKPTGCVITLVKPHYESEEAKTQRGILTAEQSHCVLERVIANVREAGWTVQAVVQSPIEGQGGNMEFLALLRPTR